MFSGGSSTVGRERRSTRTRRSSGAVRTSRKRDEEVVEVVQQPDVEELRRRRYSYFGRPVQERRKIIVPVSTRRSQVGTSRRSTSDEHRRKSKSSGSSGSSKKSPSRRTRDEGGQYVYGGVGAAAAVASERRHDEAERAPSVRSTRSKRSSHSQKDDLPSIMEQEVTPDDSISQVAERMYAPQPRKSVRKKSSSRRSLPIVAEEADHVEPSISPRKSQKRESLLESIFRRKSTSTRPVECLTCGEDNVPSNMTAKLECGHRMCHSCLRRVFRMAVKDPAHMPPRCCNPREHIALAHVDNLFDDKFKVLFNKKFDEYKTKDRIYCPNSRCGIWIRPTNYHTSGGRKYATCPKCKTDACTLCGGKMHKSADCPKDPEIARLMEQAEAEGWKRCYKCKAMIELKEGCNHITCRCTAEFCFVCGCKWKTCDCPWFNYRDLPDPDRLNEMRVPEPVQVIYRRVFNAAAPRPANLPPPPREPLIRRGDAERIRTYAEETDQRRRQERLDEDLARRLQLQTLMEPSDEALPRRHRAAQGEVFGNAATDHMNADYRPAVLGPGNMRGFGDEAMGRRGERVSGRRTSTRTRPVGSGGLLADFLGTPSVLATGPPPPPVGRRANRT
ncbi:hypothetical protein B0A48_03835 [Cryoendolithus antarcticus]|uniref:RBR-type E3 ubiquitin transferase n=1 Tax=Cryoendolithus antarcticus TaxID=1507870 RepID=A0A1V8TH05_9PEZI|nr:hypothetical protein B0A48_03835 [Cryoendolithus antarcticus]